MSYFTEEELACQHCGEKGFKDEHLPLLNAIREECGWPFVVSSGYRCPDHPIEKVKTSTGEHALGEAVDIRCHSEKAFQLMKVAIEHGVERIGVHQKGKYETRFIHLGFSKRMPGPTPWSY